MGCLTSVHAAAVAAMMSLGNLDMTSKDLRVFQPRGPRVCSELLQACASYSSWPRVMLATCLSAFQTLEYVKSLRERRAFKREKREKHVRISKQRSAREIQRG